MKSCMWVPPFLAGYRPATHNASKRRRHATARGPQERLEKTSFSGNKGQGGPSGPLLHLRGARRTGGIQRFDPLQAHQQLSPDHRRGPAVRPVHHLEPQRIQPAHPRRGLLRHADDPARGGVPGNPLQRQRGGKEVLRRRRRDIPETVQGHRGRACRKAQ